MSFPAYERSKDSGWPWIGDLPSHWDVRRLKTLFSRVTRPVEDGDKIVTAFRDGQVTLRENRREEGFTNALQEIGYQGVRRGDLVIHAMDGFAGAIGVSDSDGKSTPVYTVCVAEPDASARYYALLLRHMALSGFVTSLAKGIRERSTDFRWADASVLALPHPPLDEQVGILAFLDRETAKIDALVEAQRRLIELLKEKRQAVISHAVTKGLDPSAPMKDSGVEWLGQVPAHWELERAKFIFSRSDLPPPEDAEVVTCFRDGQVTLRRNRREDGFTFAVLEVGYQGIQPGQLVLHSMDAFAGAIGVSDSAGKCSPEYLVCDPCDEQASPAYYGLLLRLMALRGFILAVCPSVRERAPRIRFPDFGDLLLPRPPKAEQAAITAHIARETAKLDTLREVAEAASMFLQERRAALISAAVTGKIDVRGLGQTAEAA